MLSQHRLSFLGHISWIDDNHLPRQLLVCTPVNGSRPAGGLKYHRNELVLRALGDADYQRTGVIVSSACISGRKSSAGV